MVQYQLNGSMLSLVRQERDGEHTFNPCAVWAAFVDGFADRESEWQVKASSIANPAHLANGGVSRSWRTSRGGMPGSRCRGRQGGRGLSHPAGATASLRASRELCPGPGLAGSWGHETAGRWRRLRALPLAGARAPRGWPPRSMHCERSQETWTCSAGSTGPRTCDTRSHDANERAKARSGPGRGRAGHGAREGCPARVGLASPGSGCRSARERAGEECHSSVAGSHGAHSDRDGPLGE
jgi:hypothetical protein